MHCHKSSRTQAQLRRLQAAFHLFGTRNAAEQISCFLIKFSHFGFIPRILLVWLLTGFHLKFQKLQQIRCFQGQRPFGHVHHISSLGGIETLNNSFQTVVLWLALQPADENSSSKRKLSDRIRLWRGSCSSCSLPSVVGGQNLRGGGCPHDILSCISHCLPPNSVNHNQLWYTRDLKLSGQSIFQIRGSIFQHQPITVCLVHVLPHLGL
mmetsp:Transcript_15831/g.34939  ORF Transcript_15831/g.34939 Transcript_15831/m.34939 type:complete len:209 (+) Transcript_15831:191-817(+)